MYVYICIYDKRQREIEIEKTNEQKGVQEKKMKIVMMMRPSVGHGAQRQEKNKTFFDIYVYMHVINCFIIKNDFHHPHLKLLNRVHRFHWSSCVLETEPVGIGIVTIEMLI